MYMQEEQVKSKIQELINDFSENPEKTFDILDKLNSEEKGVILELYLRQNKILRKLIMVFDLDYKEKQKIINEINGLVESISNLEKEKKKGSKK